MAITGHRCTPTDCSKSIGATVQGERPSLHPVESSELSNGLAAAAVASHGWRVVYLGANLPATEIAVVANHSRAAAVALSFVHPADDPGIDAALRELRAALPKGTAIIAGGTAVAGYADALDEVGAARFASIRELRSWLRKG